MLCYLYTLYLVIKMYVRNGMYVYDCVCVFWLVTYDMCVYSNPVYVACICTAMLFYVY